MADVLLSQKVWKLVVTSVLTTMAPCLAVADAVSIPVELVVLLMDVVLLFLCLEQMLNSGWQCVVAKESNAHQKLKDKILKADIDTVISASVVGHPVQSDQE